MRTALLLRELGVADFLQRSAELIHEGEREQDHLGASIVVNLHYRDAAPIIAEHARLRQWAKVNLGSGHRRLKRSGPEAPV